MKKSKLSITLVTGFIAAMALSACSNVTSSKDAIVTFTPYGSDEKIELLTNDVYKAYNNTTNGVAKFYDKILEVLIRYQFKDQNFSEGELKYSEIEKWAENQVKEQKQKAKDNASSNKTSYDKEWKAILESNNVENAEGLKQKFIYEKEKEVMTNWYADNNENAASLKNEFLGVDAQGQAVKSDVKAAMPYHIRHILVKVDEAADAGEKFYKGTVTESQAKALANTAATLAKGQYTFAQVANMYSEDGSASKGGDLGIVTNAATSGSLKMVNEFQLGLYAYDNLYDEDNAADAAAETIRNALGFNAVVGTKDNGDPIKASEALPANVVEVPYDAFVKMGKYANVTADKKGNKLAGGSTALFPRNIVWNKYFNLHNVFVIKNVKSAAYPTDPNNPSAEFDNLAGTDVSDASLTRFNAKGYLVDEKGNVIIGVRSQFGIHFMVIEESMYDYANLATYYDTKLPTDETFDRTARSYVNYIESANLEDYKERAKDIKDAIKGFDATYDYRLYNYLKTKVTINFTQAAEGLGQRINDYIEVQQKNNAYKQEDGLRQVWRTYSELLAVQEENRSYQYRTKNVVTGDDSPVLTRLVPEKIADDFFALYETATPGTDPTYKLFTEEGDYYYYA